MALMNNYLKGSINGIFAGDFKKKLNNEIKTAEERLELVKDILEKDKEFFDIYFEQDPEITVRPIWNLCPNCSDPLSDRSPIVKELEMMASYIIFSPDQPLLVEKSKYKILKPAQFDIIKNKEINCGTTTNPESYIEFMERTVNYKKEMNQVILTKDFNDPELECLIEFEKNKKEAHEKMKYLKENNLDMNLYYKLKRLMKELKTDMIIIKEMIKKPIRWKSPLKDSGEFDYDIAFDWNNREHVRCLLQVSEKPMNTDLGAMKFDLKNLLKEINFSKIEKDVLNWFLDSDIPQRTMAKLLKVSDSNITQILDRIVDKIIFQYNLKYEDWYFLNIEKGEYIKCNKCGEIKLASENNFYKDNRKDGKFRTTCKKCLKDNNDK